MSAGNRFLVLLFVLVLLIPASAEAQNTSAGTAVDMMMGQRINLTLDATTTQRWYRVVLYPNRSYCFETGTLESSYTSGDPVVTVYASDGTTVLAENDDTPQEPDALFLSRACFAYTAAASYAYVTVTPYSGNATQSYTLRAIETTMWAPWFFVSGDYNSYLLLRNTTSSSVTFTCTWRSSSGTVVGTYTAAVPANGGVGVNAKTYISNPTLNFNGTVELTHNGSPDALVGHMTSIGATSGINFDSPFSQRKPW